MADDNVGADGVQDVNGVGPTGLPRAGGEAVRLAGQGADGTEVYDVAGQFGEEELFDVGSYLHVTATTRCA